MSFGSQESSSQQSSAPPEYAQRAQQAQLGLLNMVTEPFINASPYRVAGLTDDQLMSMDLTRQYAQNQFTNTTAPYFAEAAQLGPAAQIDISRLPSFGGGGVTAGRATFQEGDPATLIDTKWQDGTAAQLGAQDYEQFMNPYIQEVVNTTTSQAARARDEAAAQRNAQYAQAGAFGGSRQGVAQGVADSRFAQDVSTLTAQLMSQGYSEAQAAALANAQMRQQMAVTNTQGTNQINLARDTTNAGAENQLNLTNTGLRNQIEMGNAANETQASVASAQLAAAGAQAQAQMLMGAMQSNMNAQNQFSLANNQALNNTSLQNALMGNQFFNDASNRQLTGIGLLSAMGGQQQQLAQRQLDVPWETLQMIMNGVNNTAQTGRVSEGSQQSSGENFGLGNLFSFKFGG